MANSIERFLPAVRWHSRIVNLGGSRIAVALVLIAVATIALYALSVRYDITDVIIRWVSTNEYGPGHAVVWAVSLVLLGIASYSYSRWRENQTDDRRRVSIETNPSSERKGAGLSDRAVSEFLANLADELCTPLNGIIESSKLIKDQSFGPVGHPKYVEYVDEIHRCAGHLLSIASDIRDISKIDAGKLEPCDETVAAGDAVTEAAREIRPFARDAGVRITTHVADDLPHLLVGRSALMKILLNLLSNAVKFNRRNGHVTVSARTERSGACMIAVTDTGTGIAGKNLETALSRFGRVADPLTKRHKGLGLGLPLTKALIEQHGGSLTLHSTVGVGTIATVRFPAARVRAGPVAASSAARQSALQRPDPIWIGSSNRLDIGTTGTLARLR